MPAEHMDMEMRHFLSAADLTRDAALGLFTLAADVKQRRKAGRLTTPLAGKTVALIFEKPSLRTRVTFEVGIIQLGGRAVHLDGRDIGLGTRESVQDVARNLSLWVDGIMVRVFAHSTVTELARNASVPVMPYPASVSMSGRVRAPAVTRAASAARRRARASSSAGWKYSAARTRASSSQTSGTCAPRSLK